MKMKKFSLGVLAIAGILFTSCQQDNFVTEPVVDEYVNIEYTLTTGDVVRGYGLAENVDKVACTVYDEQGNEMNLYKIVPFSGGKATYNVRLAKGQNYRAAFFAYNDGGYYDVTNLKSVKINAAATNIEKRDAFTAYELIDAADLTNLSNVNKTVTLHRPFAQLNLGIDQTEYDAAKAAGIVVAKTQITVPNVWNAFSAYDDAIAADATQSTVTYTWNNVFGKELEVNGNTYYYLSLNYILVGNEGSKKDLADVVFEWEAVNGKKNSPATTFANIPVERNYRTNILGNLLTTPANFTIEIDNSFKGNYTEEVTTVITTTVNSAAELQAAINAAVEGQNIIKLGADIATTNVINIEQKKDVQILIDGQSKTVDATINIDGKNALNGTEAVSFTNVKFAYTGTAKEIVMIGRGSPNSYAHNVTLKDCTFDGPDATTAVRAYQSKDINIFDCEAVNLHSFCQITSSHDVEIDGVTSNCVRGMHIDARNSSVSNSTITTTGADKYGIRFEIGDVNDGLKIVGCNINATFPVTVRNNDGVAVESFTLTFDGTNTITKGGDYHVAIAQQEYDTVGQTLTALSGVVTTPGADASWNIFK